MFVYIEVLQNYSTPYSAKALVEYLQFYIFIVRFISIIARILVESHVFISIE